MNDNKKPLMPNPVLIKRSEMIVAKYSQLSSINVKIFNYLLKHFQQSEPEENGMCEIPFHTLVKDGVLSYPTEQDIKKIVGELETLRIKTDYLKANHKYYQKGLIQKILLYDSTAVFSKCQIARTENTETKQSYLTLNYKINKDFIELIHEADLRFIKLNLEKLFTMSGGAIRLYEILYSLAKTQSNKKQYVDLFISIQDLKELLNCDKTAIYKKNSVFVDKYLRPKADEIINKIDWKTDISIYPQEKIQKFSKETIQAAFTLLKEGKSIIGVKFCISDYKFTSVSPTKPKAKLSKVLVGKIKQKSDEKAIKAATNLLLSSNIEPQKIISLVKEQVEKFPIKRKPKFKDDDDLPEF